MSRFVDLEMKFAKRITQPFLDMLRTLCMNRSRLRRMLCHIVLDWDNVQFDVSIL